MAPVAPDPRSHAPESLSRLAEALPRLLIRRSMGDSPTSVLYLADDVEAQRPIMLSALRPDVFRDVGEDDLRRSLEAAMQLDHPCIERLIEVGRAGDLQYYTSVYQAGWSVRDKLAAHGPPPLARAVAILREVLVALAYAHAHGVAHALLTPSLVMLTEDGVVVRGFGQGPPLWAPDGDVRRRTSLATPHAPPELRSGDGPPGPAADMYAFGCLAQELLLGSPPGNESWSEVALADALRARLDEQSALRPRSLEATTRLAKLISRCLEVEPAARPESAVSGLRDLVSISEALGMPRLPGGERGPPAPPRIGPYRILDRLGHGGMGVVYRAEKVGALSRQVALKVIRRGMDSEEVTRRFEGEREALALLDHENVARIFDASVSRGGRPYFVMELVTGAPITEFVDRHRLALPERLRLFEQVCAGVQHAHQKGVIHRDLKPSNVLVSEDDPPRLKVIDFGLAKIVGDSIDTTEAPTRQGQILGTPEYMSPEQAAGAPTAVDTRSDVYSLGALLHELLTGDLPRAHGPDRELALPSRTIALLEDSDLIAARRGTRPEGLRRALAGELDHILLKALAPEPGRRYQTANELLDDLRRHRSFEPVRARPPTRAYRLGKLVRRHRAGVAGLALAVVAIVSGLAVTTGLWLRAREAEQRAATEARSAEEVLAFITGLLDRADPFEQGSDVSMREVLDLGVEELRDGLEVPIVRAAVLREMGSAYDALGLAPEAEAMYREEAELRRLLDDPSGQAEAAAMLNVANMVFNQARFDEAREMSAQVVSMLSAAAEPDPQLIGLATFVLARSHDALGHDSVADSLLARALELQEGAIGPDELNVARTLWAIANRRFEMGRLAEAEGLVERLLEIHRAMPSARLADQSRAYSLASRVYGALGRWEEAEQNGRAALAIVERELEPSHPTRSSIAFAMGFPLLMQRRFAEAAAIYEEQNEIVEAAFGPGHPNAGVTASHLGQAYAGLGRLAEARALQESALAQATARWGPDAIRTNVYAAHLARVDLLAGNHSAAARRLERVIEIRTAATSPEDLIVADAQFPLSQAYVGLGRLGEAEILARASLETRERSLPVGHLWIEEALAHHAAVLLSLGRAEEAAKQQSRLDALRRR